MHKLLAAFLVFFSSAASADTLMGAPQKQPLNTIAIALFLVFVLSTLLITYRASKKNRSTTDFYTAGGGIGGVKNGLAIAGDFMSAASFLGISAMVFMSGYDGLIYSAGFLVGWPIVLFLVAERLRNLGKFTFSDVIAYRLKQAPVRIFSATASLFVILIYLIAQMVGAGKLIEILFGLSYTQAVLIVGALMVLYVLYGGMLATTWVQIIKAVLLLAGASFMAFMVMKTVGFSFEALFRQAVQTHEKGSAILSPGGLFSNPVDSLSLGLALMFGTAGLPHILMRFFTVPDAKEARKSVFVATSAIGYFYLLTFIIGFGAIILLTNDPQYFQTLFIQGRESLSMIGGSNMTAVHLSHAIGGDVFLGFISAVTFATILAVVAGLVLSGASAVSHDLYASVLKKGNPDPEMEMKISRVTTVSLGVVAVILGLAFENQNVAFMVGLAFAVAASANFPILALAMFWKGLTTRGAIFGGFCGLFSAVILIVLGPTIWVSVLNYPAAIFPYSNPALFSIPTAFISAALISLADRSIQARRDQVGFKRQYARSVTGLGIAGATEH